MIRKNGADSRLKEVKTAGYKYSKREKNVNRKAGLHDKKKNIAEGESRVNRRKPLALKHVRRMRKAAVALSCVFVVAVGAVGAGAFLGDEGTSYTGYKTVCFEVPENAGSPTEYTLVENVGFMNYVLQNQPFWSSEMSSDVNAMGFDQHVETYKQFYNGILISCDIALGFSNKGTQYCVNPAKEVIMWRQATGALNGMDSEWSEDKISKMDFEKFIEWRGFPPSEFSVYVLNEKTIQNAEEYSVIQNADGNFEMTLELNVGLSTEEAEFAADCYYVKQMKATGDLPSLPSIKKTNVTYVFDANWRVLSFEINDEYTAMGAIPCTSKTVVTFDYKEDNAKNSFYDVFKQYEDGDSSDITDDAPSASTYLGAAFGSVLTEGGVFKIDLNADGLALNGVAYVGMDNKSLNDLRVKIGDIFVFSGADGAYYITDGNAKYKINIGGLFASGASARDISAGLDTDALMQQLMDGKFTVGENWTLLETALDIFGLKVNLTFRFIPGNGTVELDYCTAEIPLGDKVLKAKLQFGNKSDIPALPADMSGYTDILNEGVTLDLTAKLDGLTLGGFAHIAMDAGEFAGVYAELGDFSIYYDSPADMLGLSDGNVKYKLDISSLSGGANFDLGALAGGLDTSSLLSQIIANFSAGGGKISSEAALDILGQTVTAALGVQLTGGIKIDASVNVFDKDLSLCVGLTNRTVTLPDLSDYIDVLNEGITVNASLALDGAVFDGKITVGLTDGKFTSLSATFGELRIDYENSSKTLYLAVGDTKAFVNMSQIPYGTADMAGLFGSDYSKLICDVLANLSAGLREISANADINIFDCVIPANISVVLPADGESLKVKADITLFGISAKVTAGLDTAGIPTLSQEEKEVYIDALKKPFEVADQAVGGLITAEVTGTLYDYSSEYLSSSRIKYGFEATLEYDSGKDYTEGESECNPLYLRVNIGLTAYNAKDGSLYLDLLIMDANPISTGDSGKTGGGYYTDGVMDVYLSVSNKKNGTPLKIYADMDEILTLVSMVGAAANLGDIYFEDNETLSQAVATLGELLDSQLINKYIPHTQDQFSSLGASLIPQILNKSLGEFLGEIVSRLRNNTAGSGAEGANINLNAPYIESVTYGDNDLKLVLDSSAVYGVTVSEENNLTVIISKDVLENGASRLGGVDIKNIYFGEDNVNKLDLNLALSYGAIARPDQTSGLGGYLNTDGIDTLLKALVNSATHKTGVKDDGSSVYDLNHTYLLGGEINVNVKWTFLTLVDMTVNVNTLKVVIKEDNTVYADVHLTGMISGLKKANSDIYMSVMNDMMFVKRVVDGVEETRIMPVSAFLGDILNQIDWMFKLDGALDKISGMIPEGGNNGAKFEGKDLGELLDYVLPVYKYSESGNSASWSMKIGGNGRLLGDLTGMNINDVPLTFNAVKTDDGMYAVTGLKIEQTVIDLGGGAKINLNGNFSYDNPHEELIDGKEDTSKDLINGGLSELNGYTWHEVLRGESFEEICSATDWELLKNETGLNYIDFRSGSPLAVAVLKFEYAADTQNTGFTEFGERQLVLYNKNTGTVYTKVAVPELPADKNVAGSRLDWVNGLTADGEYVICRADYKNTYKVTVESVYGIDGNYIYDGAENVYRRTEEEAYKQILLKKDIVYNTDHATYSLLGYTYKGSTELINFANTAVDADGDVCFVAEVNAPADYVAVWRFSYEVTFVVRNENGEVIREIPVHYYEGEKLSSRLPELPEIKGHTGVWEYAEDITVSPDMSSELSTVYSKYTPNTYTVTVVSTQDAEGFTADGNGNYVKTYSCVYNTEITLDEVTSKHNGFNFVRYYDADKASVQTATVEDDVTYYIEWVGKTVNVTFKSDLQFTGANLVDGVYTVDASLKYGNNGDSLWGFNGADAENMFLGWFLENEDTTYKYVADANALKDVIEPLLAGKETVSVTLWAVCSSSTISGKIDTATLKPSSFTHWTNTWNVSGHVNNPLSGKSLEIANNSTDISVTYQVKYYISKDGVTGNREYGGSSFTTIDSANIDNEKASFSLNKDSSYGNSYGNYVGVQAKVSISINGEQKSSYGETGIYGTYAKV